MEPSVMPIDLHFCDQLLVPRFTTNQVDKLMASPTIDQLCPFQVLKQLFNSSYLTNLFDNHSLCLLIVFFRLTN